MTGPDALVLKHGPVSWSETFIDTHLKSLNGLLYDGPLPRSSVSQPLLGFLQAHPHLPVLCEYGTTGARALPTLLSLGRPFSVYFHGYDAHSSRVLGEYSETYPRLFDAATHLFAVSEDIALRLTGLGAPTSKVRVLPCGVEDIFFDEPPGPGYDMPTILFVGRLVEKKNPLAVVDAFAPLSDDARLFIAGEGPLEPDLRRRIQHHGLDHRVFMAGAIAHQRLPQLLDGGAFLALPSRTAAGGDAEGTPVILMEAAARGLPCISTFHGGIAAVVRDRRTGLLVSPGDREALSSAFRTLLKDSALARALGACAKAHAHAHFRASDRALELRAQLEIAPHAND